MGFFENDPDNAAPHFNAPSALHQRLIDGRDMRLFSIDAARRTGHPLRCKVDRMASSHYANIHRPVARHQGEFLVS
jgi:hypothetical protein